MMSKVIHLLMDWETFNQLPALEQVRGAMKALQISTIELLAKIISNVNLKAQKGHLRCLIGFIMCLCWWIQHR